MAQNETLGANFSIDITSLKAGLAAANRLIRESESEFKAASAGMESWSDSQEGLEASVKNLNTVTDLQQKKVDALTAEYDRLISEGLDPASAEAVKLRTQINNEQAALNKNKKALADQSAALADMAGESSDTRTATQKLKDSIGDQESELEKLKAEYADTVLEQGKSSSAAKDLGRKIAELNGEIGENKKKLDEAENSTNDLADAESDAERESGALDVAIGTLAANLVSKLVSSVGSAIGSLAGLAEETKEYRTEMAKLNGAFDSAGLSAEDAEKSYDDLYSVLGDTGKATEASMLISQITKDQQDLDKWTRIMTGVFAQYGDSIPTEGLAEAISATSAMSSVQGVLADALEWQGVNLDEYNAKLEAMTSDGERAAYIQETLTGLYGESADAYRKNNEQLIEANKAANDLQKAQADLGESIEPVNTAITELKTELMKEFAPTIKGDVIPAIKSFIEQLKQDGTVKKFADSVTKVAKAVLPPLAKALKFCAENFETLVKVTLIAVTAYKSLKAALAVTSAITAAKTAVAGLAAGTKVVTAAQVGWNAAMSANPIGAVVTAVALLAGGIALLSANLGEADGATDLLSESQRASVDSAKEAAEAYASAKEESAKLAEANLSTVDHVKNLARELKNYVDENGNVTESDKARVDFILEEMNKALGTEYESIHDVIEANGELKQSVLDVMEAKKAQILLEAYEDDYLTAIQNRSEAERALANQQIEIEAQRDIYNKKNTEAMDARAELDQRVANAKTESDYRALASEAQRVTNMEEGAQREKKTLEGLTEKYDESKETLYKYYSDISSYETAKTLLMGGKTQEAISYLDNLSAGFRTQSQVAGESVEEQKRILGEQVEWTRRNAEFMKKAYADGVEGVTQEMVDTAEEQADTAEEEFEKIGENISEGIATGAESKKTWLGTKISGLVSGLVSAAKKALDSHSPSKVFEKQVGINIPLGIAAGIDDGTGAVLKSVKGQIGEIEGAYKIGKISASVSASVSGSGSGTAAAASGNVVINQTNNYSQEKSRYEIYKTKQDAAAAVRLAIGAV